MSMNMSSGSSSEPEAMLEMNMTPLIDVMLVLIIMFIITLPIANHSVNLNMPNNQTRPQEPPEPPVVVTIDVDFDGTLSWDGEVITRAQLESKLLGAATMTPQPEVHLRPNKLVSYKAVAAVMASAQKHGVTKLGMIGNEQFLK